MVPLATGGSVHSLVANVANTLLDCQQSMNMHYAN